MNSKIRCVFNLLIICCFTVSCSSNKLTPKKFQQAQQKAALGDLDAQYVVARAHYYGNGGQARETVKGFKMMKDLALKGYVRAQDTLGCFYVHKENYEEGIKWVKKAAEEGNDSEAQWRLGAWYEDGDCGLRKSDAMAEYWYRKSALQGDILGCGSLDRLLWK